MRTPSNFQRKISTRFKYIVKHTPKTSKRHFIGTKVINNLTIKFLAKNFGSLISPPPFSLYFLNGIYRIADRRAESARFL